MDKILVITYYWPPSGGAGVQRWLKFTKYLPQYGIEPIILTVDPEYASYPQRDASLIKEISPDLKIIKTKSATGIFTAYKKVTRKDELPYGGFVNEGDPGLIQKIFRFTRGNFFLPDARRGWNRYALKAAVKVIENYHIEIVVTSSPPHSTQLIGRKLKKKLGIRWIADLRDPWTDIYYSDKIFQTWPARWINRKMESLVLKDADRVIATCNATCDVFRSKLPLNQTPEKVITITNGFDTGDFGFEKTTPERFTITYLGTLAGSYDIGVLVKALDLIDTVEKKEITLLFIGKTDNRIIAGLREEGKVSAELIPYVDHRKAMEYLSRSAALLLVIPSSSKTNEMIPGKLFEYLASKRPVIAIGPKQSDAGIILRETGGGMIFDKTDVKELADYLLELLNNFRKGLYETDPKSLDQYSRENLAAKFAGILNTPEI
jgi:glycosyltransferase involved in cell wall biosynthesis